MPATFKTEGAVKPPAVSTATAPPSQERVDEFFEKYLLGEYCEAFKAAGYTFLEDLRDADEGDFAAAEPLGGILDKMKRPDRKRLIKRVPIKPEYCRRLA
jgi:hypothetical protein